MEIAVLFPGQGAHYLGMGRDLYDKSGAAREVFSNASDVLGFDVATLCFHGSFSELNQPQNMFPAILTLGVAMHQFFSEEVGERFERIYAGHSLGEYSALIAAGGLTLADGLRLVRYRGLLSGLVKQNFPGSMVVVDGISLEVLKEIADTMKVNESSLFIACYNSDDQFVVAAFDEIFAPLQKAVHAKGGMVTPLPSGAPFHTPFMELCQAPYKEELDKCSLNRPQKTVIANVTARPYRSGAEVYQNLLCQLVRPVRWNDIMQSLVKRGISHCIEMSAKAILSGLFSRSNITLPVFIFGQEESHRLWQGQWIQSRG